MSKPELPGRCCLECHRAFTRQRPPFESEPIHERQIAGVRVTVQAWGHLCQSCATARVERPVRACGVQ